MTAEDLRDARRTLGEAWGLDRPLTLEEMAQVLRLAGRDPGASLRDYERGKTQISGPLSLVVELLLAGGRTPEVNHLVAEKGGSSPQRPAAVDLLFKAALAGFAVSKEGFNGETWFSPPSDEEVVEALEAAGKNAEIRAELERALKLAGIR